MKRILKFITILLVFCPLALGRCGGDSTTTKSPEKQGTVDSTPPGVKYPGVKVVDTGYTEIKIQWFAAYDDMTEDDSLLYKVVRSRNNNIQTVQDAENNGIVVRDWTRDRTEQLIRELENSTLYFVNVLVKDEAGNISAYSGISATTDTPPDITPPVLSSQVITFKDISYKSLTVQWEAASDAVTQQDELEYTVYRSGAGNIDSFPDAEANGTCVLSWTSALDWTAGETTLNILGLNLSSTYYFNVFVKDVAGNIASYNTNSQTTLTDSTAPTPGSGVSADEDGSAISLSWGEATDETALIYRLVRSDSSITNLTQADAAQVIIDYTSFDGISMPVSDTGLPAGIYYYNVIVMDEGGNRALYSGVSGTITSSTYSVYGLINLPGEVTDGNYILEISDPFTFEIYSTSASWVSGSIQDYEINGVTPGDYFINVLVTDNSGNVIYYIYSSYLPELAVDDSDVVQMINAEPFVSVNVDDYESCDDNGFSTTNSINPGESQNHTFHYQGDEDYIKISLSSQKDLVISTSFISDYTDTVLYLYDSSESLLDSSDNSSGLYSRISCSCDAGLYYIRVIEKGNDGTGYYVLKVMDNSSLYSVSGDVRLPAGDIMNGGYYYYIDIYSGDNYYSVFEPWPAESGTASFTVHDVPPGNYSRYAAVVDGNDNVHYEYDSDSAELTVIDSDITNSDIEVVSTGDFYVVNGNISLPGTDVLSEGYYIIEIYDSLTGIAYTSSGFWPTNSAAVAYLIDDIPPANYSVTARVMDGGYTNLYEYDSGSEDLSVSTSNVTYNVEVIAIQ